MIMLEWMIVGNWGEGGVYLVVEHRCLRNDGRIGTVGRTEEACMGNLRKLHIVIIPPQAPGM